MKVDFCFWYNVLETLEQIKDRKAMGAKSGKPEVKAEV